MSSQIKNNIIIFLTGGAILALELLSSRILNPYFGVSLYIWAGILSITLIALSFGYRRGGSVSSLKKIKETSSKKAELEYRFLSQPAESSIALAIACGFYPIIFYDLAMMNLVWGAFIASAFILLVPLVSMSSMNPILIAIENLSEETQAGRSAGDVLFISTMGSVAGVVITAFVLIPNLTNYSTILYIGIFLAVISLSGGLLSTELTPAMKKKLTMVSSAGIIMCVLLLYFSPTYLRNPKGEFFGGHTWKIEKEYPSIFGHIKVISRDGGDAIYYHNEHRQSHIGPDGRSVSAYSYGMESFVTSASTMPKRALVLGLAGGIVPLSLAQKGIDMEVVDIVPESLVAAKEYFNFDDELVKVHIADARTFVKQCSERYDVVLVDISAGGSVPEYLVTREFYGDVRSCISSDGFIVLNTIVAGRQFMGEHYHILKTLKSVYANVDIYYDETVQEGRSFTVYVVASDVRPSFDFVLDEVPEDLRGKLSAILGAPKPLDKILMAKAEILTDENNYYSFLSKESTLKRHRHAVSAMPPMFLVN